MPIVKRKAAPAPPSAAGKEGSATATAPAPAVPTLSLDVTKLQDVILATEAKLRGDGVRGRRKKSSKDAPTAAADTAKPLS